MSAACNATSQEYEAEIARKQEPAFERIFPPASPIDAEYYSKFFAEHRYANVLLKEWERFKASRRAV